MFRYPATENKLSKEVRASVCAFDVHNYVHFYDPLIVQPTDLTVQITMTCRLVLNFLFANVMWTPGSVCSQHGRPMQSLVKAPICFLVPLPKQMRIWQYSTRAHYIYNDSSTFYLYCCH